MSNEDEGEFDLELESSLGAPFCMMMPAELLDSRLTYGARCLIAWLRFRVGWNRDDNRPKAYTNVKVRTIVEDFGCNPKTMSGWLRELEDIGLLVRKTGGFGRSQKKMLVDPVKVYGNQRIHNVYHYLKSENRPDAAGFLNNTVPNFSLSPKTGESVSPETGESLSPKTGVSLSPKTGVAEVDTREVDTTEVETREKKEPLRGTSVPDRTIERVPNTLLKIEDQKSELLDFNDSSYSEVKASRVEDDSQRIASIRASFTQSTEVIAESIRKKQKSIREGSTGFEAAKRREAKADAKAERDKNRPPSAKTAEAWWRERHRVHHPGITHTRWNTKEMKWSAEMIADYGPRVVEKAFDYVFDNWERYRRDYAWQKLGLVPGIDFLYRERKNIMADVETLLQSDTGGTGGDGGESDTFF